MSPLCGKCGRPLKPGELRYQVKIELTSMFDGYIEEADEDMDEELERLIQALTHQDPEEVAKDVAQSITLVICRQCRNKLVHEWDVKTVKVFH